MDQRRDNLLLIGSFARATQLSLKALRLYAELGLLVPRYVDPDNGYRFYHVNQLPTARLIRALRQMDMPLATIRRVLAATPADAETLVRAHVDELERRAADARRMVYSVVNMVQQEKPTMALEVSVRKMAAQPIISITRHTKVDKLKYVISSGVDTLQALLQQHGAHASGAPFGIYHGPINNEDDGPIEVCMPVQHPIAATEGDVQARELPGGSVVAVLLTGEQCEFPAVLHGYDATADWISSNGYEQADPPWEIWHSAPGPDQRMEVAWPFR